MVDLSKDRNRIAATRGTVVVLVGAGLVVGVVLGLLLDPVAGWVASQDWLPASGVRDQLDRFAGWAPVWAQVVVGAVVGVGAGTLLVGQTTAVEVDGREVVVVEGSTRQRFARSQVGEARVDGRRLTLRDPADVDLVTTTVDGDADDLRAALQRHGWPVGR